MQLRGTDEFALIVSFVYAYMILPRQEECTRLTRSMREFELQLRANQRSVHTISSYVQDLQEVRGWLTAEQLPDDVRHLDGATLCRFATSAA